MELSFKKMHSSKCFFQATPYCLSVLRVHLVFRLLSDKYSQHVCQVLIYCQVSFPIRGLRRGPKLEPCGTPGIIFSYVCRLFIVGCLHDVCYSATQYSTILLYSKLILIHFQSRKRYSIGRHIVLQLVSHDKYNQICSISQLKVL